MVRPFLHSGRCMILVSLMLLSLQNSEGNYSGALNTPGWEKVVIFDRNHHLSWKWYEIGLCLL